MPLTLQQDLSVPVASSQLRVHSDQGSKSAEQFHCAVLSHSSPMAGAGQVMWGRTSVVSLPVPLPSHTSAGLNGAEVAFPSCSNAAIFFKEPSVPDCEDGAISSQHLQLPLHFPGPAHESFSCCLS